MRKVTHRRRRARVTATLLRRCSDRNPTSPAVLLRTMLNTITCSRRRQQLVCVLRCSNVTCHSKSHVTPTSFSLPWNPSTDEISIEVLADTEEGEGATHLDAKRECSSWTCGGGGVKLSRDKNGFLFSCLIVLPVRCRAR